MVSPTGASQRRATAMGDKSNERMFGIAAQRFTIDMFGV